MCVNTIVIATIFNFVTIIRILQHCLLISFLFRLKFEIHVWKLRHLCVLCIRNNGKKDFITNLS